MDRLTLLREGRLAGLTVGVQGGRLVVRGPQDLEPVARELLAHKDEVLEALAFMRSEVLWRIEAMRSEAPEREPIPLLLARPEAVRGLDCCCSCGARLGPDEQSRCRACVEAATEVLLEFL
jgi:hypothetical protein